jgi:hypothetical protein
MTEAEIEDMKKELILLRMHKQRLEDDIKKMQAMIKDILMSKISSEEEANDGMEPTKDTVGNGA